MDPITHAVIGMAASKIAGHAIDISEPATVAIVIGSVIPDIDIVMQKWGDYAYLKNHRGVTHSILGLLGFSMLITVILAMFFPESKVYSLFIWSMMGCLSHTFFDIFNPYGAKILWPFSKRKFSLSLLIVFDPVFLGLLLAYIFSDGKVQYMFLVMFAVYVVLRAVMRMLIGYQLKRTFGHECENISILPSMTGLLRWHFILEKKKCKVIGEKSIFKRNINIIRTLHKLHDNTIDSILCSSIGSFFREFTPLFHIACENADGVTKYIFTDLRYYIRNNFLHHAVLEVDQNNTVIRQTFNPYTINRSNIVS